MAHIAKKYFTDENDRDDLVSIGTIGLIKAVDSFRPDRGIRLSSYASGASKMLYYRSGTIGGFEVENHEPFGAKWSMFCRLKVRSYVLAANVAGTLKVAPLQILKFPGRPST